jgi:hypothetical protein
MIVSLTPVKSVSGGAEPDESMLAFSSALIADAWLGGSIIVASKFGSLRVIEPVEDSSTDCEFSVSECT